MFRIIFLSVISIISFVSYAQEKTLPAEATGFLPAGFELLDYVTGDLNGDKKEDAILLAKQPGEDSIMEEELKRPMIILTRQANGKLKQVFRNDNAILCRHCGGVFGDPYESISINPGSFEIIFYGGSSWRWGYTYNFKYNALKKNWYLASEKQVNFHSGDPEGTTKVSLVTAAELGEIPFSAFKSEPVYLDSRWKVKSDITYFYDNPDLASKPRKGYLLKGNIVVGIRHLKNFIEASYDNGKGTITQGYLLKKDLQPLK